MKNYRDSSAVFATVPGAPIQRSVFARNIDYKTTLDAGYLVPFYLDEVLPGDTIMLNTLSIFARATTLAVPVMDNIYFDWFFFFVPNRLVWKHWKAMQGEKVALDSSTDYTLPVVKPPTDGNGWTIQSLADYFGARTGIDGVDLQALPFRAYNLIYDEWFRDENLCAATNMANEASYGDGPDTAADYVVRKSGKRHDIFTSCLPWPQKPLGNTSVITLPLGTEAPVISNNKPFFLYDSSHAYQMATNGNQSTLVYSTVASSGTIGTQTTPTTGTSGQFPGLGFYKSNTGLKADLTSATAALWTTVRNVAQFQKILERQARGGTRYAEILRTAFGVQPADARLQRPEFLASGSTMVKISAVAQTSATSAGVSPQAHLAAYATVSDTSRGLVYSATEHGMIMGIIRARADLNYQQGTPKLFFKSTFYDFYRPELACISEQPVYNREIFTQGTSADAQVFGYQEAWYEYRYNMPMITGKLRSDAANSLDVWHLAQDFASLPALNQTFIEESVPMSRVKAVASEPDFKVDIKGIAKWVRPMPVYSVPGLVDHF